MLTEREVHREQHGEGIITALGALTATKAAKEGQSVLVVEDEGFVRDVTCQVLISSGYAVLNAKDATEGKELLRKSAFVPWLLLTDIVLPDQNGCELAQDNRAVNPTLIAIFMSGYPNNVISRFPQQPRTFYLPKPFSASSLLGAVRRAIECVNVDTHTATLAMGNGDS
jgi:DNA-binding NtrC family response regulator